MRVKMAEIRQLYWRRWLVIGHILLTVMKTNQLLHQSFHVSIAFGVLGRRVLLLMVAGFVYTHQRKSFRELTETLRNGHEEYPQKG